MAKPKYEKIAEALQKDILKGVLAPDSKLPTTAELAKKFNVSYVTMSNAIQLLQTNGYVNAIQGNGIFVNSDMPQKNTKYIYWHAPIEGDLYGRCFRAAQDALEDTNYRLIPAISHERLLNIALENPKKAEKLLKDYCANPFIIEGTRHFPFSLLKKVNPSGRGIYFLLHAECRQEDFPEAVTVVPDFRQTGMIAAKRLHSLGVEHLFVLSYENISEKEMQLADNPAFTYEKLILDGVNEYAAQNNLPPAEIYRTRDKHIADFEHLEPLFEQKCGFMAIGDNRAHTLYRYAKKNNIEIGKTWHVIGMGKTDWCDIMEPHLESVSLEEIPLVRRLITELINNTHSKYIELPTQL